mmetsp:Transcript_32549/g.95758  ORF Transcript_32549/g.95758 Transcript_32549/m.95758 type:complete len:215 (+) Transcript_32549:5966-6610(+)
MSHASSDRFGGDTSVRSPRPSRIRTVVVVRALAVSPCCTSWLSSQSQKPPAVRRVFSNPESISTTFWCCSSALCKAPFAVFRSSRTTSLPSCVGTSTPFLSRTIILLFAFIIVSRAFLSRARRCSSVPMATCSASSGVFWERKLLSAATTLALASGASSCCIEALSCTRRYRLRTNRRCTFCIKVDLMCSAASLAKTEPWARCSFIISSDAMGR